MTSTLEPRTTPDLTPQQRVDAWLADFEAALAVRDIERVVGMFAVDSFWRDLVSFTWNLKTLEGRDQIAGMLESRLIETDPSGFRTREAPTQDGDVTSAFIEFETGTGRGTGHLRLRSDSGTDQAWTLLTALQELKGHEEPKGATRVLGAVHGDDPDPRSWAEKKAAEDAELGRSVQPYTLVIGGGQGGIALGARLRQLGVPAIVVDTPRAARGPVAQALQVAVPARPGLVRPPAVSAVPAELAGVRAEGQDRRLAGVLHPRDGGAVLVEDDVPVGGVRRRRPRPGRWRSTATASASRCTRPSWCSRPACRASRTCPPCPARTSSAATSTTRRRIPDRTPTSASKAVVIGSNNSAHDICKALYENGVDVTMVQRSSTHIVKSDTLMDIGLGDLYSERALAAGMTTEKADLTFASLPYRIMHEFQIPLYDQMRERDKEFYDRLEAAGFELDWGADGSGLFMKYLRRGSGYYIDVGACDLVADGRIKLAHGQVDHLTEDSVVLADGTELPADVVVYATGYGSMNGWAADLIGQEVADRVGKVWGLGSDTPKDPGPWEGEQRNMWKPTQQPNLWFHGGNLHQSRHYSLYLALQLKARYEGMRHAGVRPGRRCTTSAEPLRRATRRRRTGGSGFRRPASPRTSPCRRRRSRPRSTCGRHGPRRSP